MCGICGIYKPGGLAESDSRVAAAMAKVMRHRGPDDSGVFADDHAALGHQRLSIIDLGGGHQPLAN